MARLGLLPLLLVLAAQCGVARHAPTKQRTLPPPRTGPRRHVTLHLGEHRTFRPGALRPGDLVTCFVSGQHLKLRIPNHPAGSYGIGAAVATPTGTGGTLQLDSKPDGSVTASCHRGKG